ncbi:MAG: NAD(P)/FAD-dependent oxidoreductase [Gemmatimonadetes bacterium]|nr:NAD(P)/FAD-dependent oxidoreductase [Gemmatimonadota bacterium]
MTIRDAIVIGAGPAGSATASFLAERGFDVALLERARFPRPKPCAEYLSPEASRILDRLGVTQRIETLGPAHLAGMRIISPSGASFVGRFVSGHGYKAHTGYGLALPRTLLDSVLADAARTHGAELLEDTTVERVSQEGASASVAVRTPNGVEHLKARIVIAADGLNSRTARHLDLNRRGGRRRVALVTHATGVADMTNVGEMHVGPRGYVGLAPVGHGLTNVAIVSDLSRTDPIGPPADWFARLVTEFPEVERRMAGAHLESPVRAVGPFARWTRRATADRVMLVGDAADFCDPFTGEGIYSALRGAELVADRAAEALNSDKTCARDLAGYDADRRRVFGGKWWFERLVSGAVALPAVFNHIVSRLARHPMAGDLMIGVAGDFIPFSRLLRPSYVWQLVA